MTQQASLVLVEALRLSEAERADLVAKLLESLDPQSEADAEHAWGEEVRQRLEDLATGAVRPIPWPEARRLIREDMDEPAEP
jgi:putative addiction module component (TIGR02574 family)